MNELYPLKFAPILKDKIWGGKKLKALLNKKNASDICGESWEISGLEGNVSVVSEGPLAGNELTELIEIYMGDLLGDKVFETFGLEFPLLLKFIDAADILSIQVHPNDTLALERHSSFGKTEIWYIIQSDEGAELITGFNKKLDKISYTKLFESGNLESVLNYEKVSPGDIYFLPAGRVHAIGKGILLAEIQQSSDITYRIFDFNRKDKNGNPRELHNDAALDALDFMVHDTYKTLYPNIENKTVNAVNCRYFNVNVMNFDKSVEKDFNFIDSFVIYMCTGGEGEIIFGDGEADSVRFVRGETILVPALLKNLIIKPFKPSTLLEVYVK
jgi:mannose-6-phosphate isomerase